MDEEEKGRGTPNSHAALLMPLSQSKLGWIGPCTARDAIDEWPRAVGVSDRLCHGYRLIQHAKIYIFNLAKSTLSRGKRVDIAGSNSLQSAGCQMRTGWSEPNRLQIHFLQSTGKGL